MTLADPPISRTVAAQILLHELQATYLPSVRRQCPGLYALAFLEQDPRRLCAIVDFAYNLDVGRLQTSTELAPFLLTPDLSVLVLRV